MSKSMMSIHDVPSFELAGERHYVVRQRDFLALCRRAGVTPPDEARGADEGLTRDALSADRLGPRLIDRRRAAGLSQVELARRARVRVETLNRIERGRTNPDFTTVRKIAEALRRATVQARSATR